MAGIKGGVALAGAVATAAAAARSADSHRTLIKTERKEEKQSCLSSRAPGGVIVFPFSGASFKGVCG